MLSIVESKHCCMHGNKTIGLPIKPSVIYPYKILIFPFWFDLWNCSINTITEHKVRFNTVSTLNISSSEVFCPYPNDLHKNKNR